MLVLLCLLRKLGLLLRLILALLVSLLERVLLGL